jgi:hypothetical protein
VLLFCAVGSGLIYSQLLERNREHLTGDYLPEAYFTAAAWLEEHAESDDVVIAGPFLAPMLPGRSGVNVFAGHWALTLDAERKWSLIAILCGSLGPLDPARTLPLLHRNRIRFIVIDSLSLAPAELDDVLAHLVPVTRVAFETEELAICEVLEHVPTSNRVPWAGGDWIGDATVPSTGK